MKKINNNKGRRLETSYIGNDVQIRRKIIHYKQILFNVGDERPLIYWQGFTNLKKN